MSRGAKKARKKAEVEVLEFPEVLPLLPVQDLVIFPYVIVPLLAARGFSVSAVQKALEGDRMVFLAAQKNGAEDEPTPDTIYPVGTVGMIMRARRLSDGRMKLLVQGLVKARIVEYARKRPAFVVRLAPIAEPGVAAPSLEAAALMRTSKELLEKISGSGESMPPGLLQVIGGIDEPGRLADLVASNLDLRVPDAQEVLECDDPVERLKKVVDLLRKEKAVQAMQQKLEGKVRDEMLKSQREYYLREQLRLIQQELGETDEKDVELRELKERLDRSRLPSEAEAEAKKQIARLDRMHQDSAEAAVIRTHLEWLAELPWNKVSEDRIDLVRALEILDEDHFGLEKVKERILEHLGVCKLKKAIKGPLLCFVGPPGVGKTSLGRSIARALGRSFVRISLGGVRDEAEIRGHRRTYVGALPGRVLQGIKQAGTRNPVFMLDEMDKIGQDFRGDPAAALLEVLDPEQNVSFRDHYLGVPFDLSGVLFVATANRADPIPGPLLDRMEVIELAGYTEEEKLAIARRHLVQKQLKESGLKPAQLHLSLPVLKRVVREYTREAGVRNLEREIAALCRKAARQFAEGRRKPVQIEPGDLPALLGPPRYLPEPSVEADEVGLVTGLAWTSEGGEVLHVETSAMAGKGGLILTGQLGDVMKESAQAALSYVRAREREFGIPDGFFASHELHIHVPAGAIPKDGPSAGVAMVTAIVSAATGRPVRRAVAMTGEITLRGRVLPVGGVKEKLLAAVRYGIKTVLVPQENEKDLAELPATARAKLEIVPVSAAEQVLERALADAVHVRTRVLARAASSA